MLQRITLFTLLVLSFGILQACQGDYRAESIGGYSEVIVVMDSTMIDSETAIAIQNTFGAPILTMPRPEPRLDVVFRDLRTSQDMELIERHKNVVIVSPIDADTNVGTFLRSLLGENVQQSIRNGESFSYQQTDVWSRNQLVMMLSAPTDEELATNILREGRRLTNEMHQKELQRWHRYVYRRAEQTDLSQRILDTYGWTFRIQHDYRVGVDTLNFLSLRRYLPDNDRWIWVSWIDDVESFDEVNREWISARRDSLNRQYMRGGSEGKFVRTDFERPYEQRFLEINGMEAYESRGLWRMENDLMGGPFINYTMFDSENNRLFMIEYGQFSPRWDQRRFLYQFEAMARTFVSDPEAIVPRDES